MHEMSIMGSIMEIVMQELDKHGMTKMLGITIKHGALSNIVPEALEFAFEAMTKGTEHDGAVLTLEEVPLRVVCSACKTEFEPQGEVYNVLYLPCPKCGEEFGHQVISGKELYVDSIEAE